MRLLFRYICHAPSIVRQRRNCHHCALRIWCTVSRSVSMMDDVIVVTSLVLHMLCRVRNIIIDVYIRSKFLLTAFMSMVLSYWFNEDCEASFCLTFAQHMYKLMRSQWKKNVLYICYFIAARGMRIKIEFLLFLFKSIFFRDFFFTTLWYKYVQRKQWLRPSQECFIFEMLSGALI